MLRPTLLAVSLLLALPGGYSSSHAAEAACQSTVSGDLRLHTLQSKVFDNQRTIRVLLPEGYDEPAQRDRRYPVLYMLDGQNLFDACLSDVSHHEWGLDEIALRLAREGKIPPMIIVGVDHAGSRRAHEYLPYRDYLDQESAEEPAGKRFPDFLGTEVMPLVNSRYRTLTGHANTGLGGSSYGGVATLYALLARPWQYGYGLIESPSLHIGMGQLVRDTDPLVAMPVRVFLGFGGREADDPAINAKLVALVRKVESNFRAAGYDDSNIRFVLEPDARHTEAAWQQRLPDALTFLFGQWQPPPPAAAQ
jgi:predicted alpha/beta superfamily hydrolase